MAVILIALVIYWLQTHVVAPATVVELPAPLIWRSWTTIRGKWCTCHVPWDAAPAFFHAACRYVLYTGCPRKIVPQLHPIIFNSQLHDGIFLHRSVFCVACRYVLYTGCPRKIVPLLYPVIIFFYSRLHDRILLLQLLASRVACRYVLFTGCPRKIISQLYPIINFYSRLHDDVQLGCNFFQIRMYILLLFFHHDWT